jgi:hypothetical protein
LWFSLVPPVSSTNETDCHDITEILLKVALNTIKQTNSNENNTLVIYTKFISYDQINKIYKYAK